MTATQNETTLLSNRVEWHYKTVVKNNDDSVTFMEQPERSIASWPVNASNFRLQEF